jgi:hypothetical protein
VQRVEEKTAAASRFTKILQAAEQLREGHELTNNVKTFGKLKI